MSKIKCGQKKCKYNTSEYCMKSGIYVDEHANCDSYEEGKKVDNSKFEFGTFERQENTIKCNAIHCKYNENKNSYPYYHGSSDGLLLFPYRQ